MPSLREQVLAALFLQIQQVQSASATR